MSRHCGTLEFAIFVWTKLILVRCYTRSTNSCVCVDLWRRYTWSTNSWHHLVRVIISRLRGTLCWRLLCERISFLVRCFAGRLNYCAIAIVMDVAMPGVWTIDVVFWGLVFKASWRSWDYVFRVDDIYCWCVAMPEVRTFIDMSICGRCFTWSINFVLWGASFLDIMARFG